MAINPKSLLVQNAEAFAAGKVLGMTEDEVLTRLEILRKEKNIENSNRLNAAFLDDVVKNKFDALEDAPTGRQLLREARSALNRAGGRKKGQKATPEQREAAMKEVLERSLRAEIMMEKAKREDPYNPW